MMSTVTTAEPRIAPRKPRPHQAETPHATSGAFPASVQPEPAATGVADARTWARQLRCQQWLKNLVVLAAPVAAGSLGNSVVLARAALAFVVFCLLSSAVYLCNDIVDLDEDRGHPTKRYRPIAAGLIAIPEALIAAGGCTIIAIITAALVDARLLLVAVSYAGLNLAYSSWARRVPILDIVAVAGCFVLRALAGGAATGIGVSGWLILAVMLGALLISAGKRHAEIADRAARRSRAVLRRYDLRVLRRIEIGSSLGAILAYAAWALGGGSAGVPALRALGLVAFGAVLFRYVKLAGQGRGGAPDRLLLEDRQLQLSALLWGLLLLTGA
ncbi:MAG TPA: decaprenyl-phosphate phosphoribosyltransferase [Solirubrobacteraceae bacterium]|nr:decaprenyl-phosphate phosphoribosyltransferase [Solirubrobacteraceae bacterium]